MKPGARLWEWLDRRIAIGALWRHGAKHRVPPETTSSRYGWLYVLGFVLYFAVNAIVIRTARLPMCCPPAI